MIFQFATCLGVEQGYSVYLEAKKDAKAIDVELRTNKECVKAWQNWQAITSSIIKKREAKVQAELAHRMDKVSFLRLEITQLEKQQDMAKENFEWISHQIKNEIKHSKLV